MRQDQALQLQSTLTELISRCPKIRQDCYWAGTSAIALEELQHRDSFDLDLHTIHALADVRPMLSEIQIAFTDRLTLIEAPNPYGSGFQGSIQLDSGAELTLQVMANFEEVPLDQLVPSRLVPGIRRVGLAKYLRDKLTCLVERAEARIWWTSYSLFATATPSRDWPGVPWSIWTRSFWRNDCLAGPMRL